MINPEAEALAALGANVNFRNQELWGLVSVAENHGGNGKLGLVLAQSEKSDIFLPLLSPPQKPKYPEAIPYG